MDWNCLCQVLAAAWDRIKELVDKIEVESDEEISLTKINNESDRFKVMFWEKELPLKFEENKKYVFVGPTGRR